MQEQEQVQPAFLIILLALDISPAKFVILKTSASLKVLLDANPHAPSINTLIEKP